MLFNTEKEAMKHAGKLFTNNNVVTYMDYSKHSYNLLNEAMKYKRKIGEPNIQYDGNFFYIKYNNLFNIFETGERININKQEMINKYPYQYFSFLFHESLKDSDNWIFKENLTKEQIEAKENIFKNICVIFNKLSY
ncbi:hypothetical protein [Clostridium sp.]|uniref:hypothetical protein n=1 Tax=Clostridium sp. TaxID=1506 RepID=UPI002617AAC8|nr:hypothetical protein [Clostridium sp.]